MTLCLMFCDFFRRTLQTLLRPNNRSNPKQTLPKCNTIVFLSRKKLVQLQFAYNHNPDHFEAVAVKKINKNNGEYLVLRLLSSI